MVLQRPRRPLLQGSHSRNGLTPKPHRIRTKLGGPAPGTPAAAARRGSMTRSVRCYAAAGDWSADRELAEAFEARLPAIRCPNRLGHTLAAVWHAPEVIVHQHNSCATGLGDERNRHPRRLLDV